MTGRWSCGVLVLVLVACRTPQKNVSVYPVSDTESGSARHLHTGSDSGETVNDRMNLINCADTKTATNSPVTAKPPAKSAPPVTGELPVKSAAQTEVMTHLKTGELPAPAVSTNATAHFEIPGHSNPQGFAPVSQPIHLNLSAWTNSAVRETASLAGLNAGQVPAPVHRQLSTSVNIPVNDASNLVAIPGPVRAIALPAVGTVSPSAVEVLSQPVDLVPLLDGAHDEAWRQRQADRQRAAENARQSERDSLEKTLQQFLQPVTK